MSEMVSYFELREDNGDGRTTTVAGRVSAKHIADAWKAEEYAYRSYQYVSFYIYDSLDGLNRALEAEKIKKILAKMTPEEAQTIRDYYSK